MSYSSLFNAEITAALAQPNIAIIYAVRLDWPSGIARFHSEIGNFSHFPFDFGERYTGVGSLGGIGNIAYGDGNDTKPAVTLELNVLDDAIRNEITSGQYQGRVGEIYMLVTNSKGEILAWCELFAGVMDSASLTQGKKNSVSLPLVCPDDGLDTGLSWRCTNESHKAQFAGDAFYKYTEHMEDFAIYFGDKKDGIPLRNLG